LTGPNCDSTIERNVVDGERDHTASRGIVLEVGKRRTRRSRFGSLRTKQRGSAAELDLLRILPSVVCRKGLGKGEVVSSEARSG